MGSEMCIRDSLIIANITQKSFKVKIKTKYSCSFWGIFLFFASAIPLIFIAKSAYNKLQIRETKFFENKTPFLIGSMCLIGGFISSVGVSGSLIVSCSLLVLGLDPLVVKCTIGVVLFGLTINNLVQFSLSNYADWQNAVLMGCLSFFACLLANFGVKVLMEKMPLEYTHRVICLSSFVMSLSLCFAVPATFYSEWDSMGTIFHFGSIC